MEKREVKRRKGENGGINGNNHDDGDEDMGDTYVDPVSNKPP